MHIHIAFIALQQKYYTLVRSIEALSFIQNFLKNKRSLVNMDAFGLEPYPFEPNYSEEELRLRKVETKNTTRLSTKDF